MSNPLPKEKQTAYERWELASFGDTRSAALAAEQAIVDAANKAKADLELEQHIQVVVGERLEALRIEAHAEGYAAGLIEGREMAYAECRIDTAQDAASFREVGVAFGHEVAEANESMAQDILTLALDLAKAMLKSALVIKPELILPVISDAVLHLPAVTQPATLHVHPQDAALIRKHMEADLTKAGWRINEDSLLERGGCRVETATNQIDATLPTRWLRIADALGQQSDWLVK